MLTPRTRLIAALMLTTVGLGAAPESAKGQHRKVPEDRVQFVDAVTGAIISEVLVMPRYSLAKGVFIAPEGPRKAVVSNYLDYPFVYRDGEPFKIKQPLQFVGLPLIQVSIGQMKDLDGILVVARDYSPLWTDDLWWPPGQQRKLKLSPIPHERWLLLMKSDLGHVLTKSSRLRENCELWQIGERCDLKIKYDRKERELVRSFLTERSQDPK